MADLEAEHLATFAMVFEATRALDAADGGDDQARRLVRLLTPMAKALSGKAAIFSVSEAMEAIGGNGYIEESVLPRLLRDAQVLPIWEGATNILVLDALRAVRKESSHEALFARISAAIEAGPEEGRAPLRDRMRRDQKALGALASQGPEAQQRAARGWMEAAGRTLQLALLHEASADAALRQVCEAASIRIAARQYSTVPLGANASGLEHTEEVLLLAARGRQGS